jgi:dTDP-4-amino-4,6-dideoxygalactose transaminase
VENSTGGKFMITVTRAYLPSEERLQQKLQEVWQSGILTNNGPQLRELERRLNKVLDTKGLQIVSNGTIAIQLALRALGVKGKVLTTPYSYVATTNSILWEYCEPVFIDIDPFDFNVNVDLIEAKLKSGASAMLFTHVYGLPCNVERISALSEKYAVPVIYDAAHAFGVRIHRQSVLNYGDVSTLSFHATKIFHMVEGGAMVAGNQKLFDELFLYKSFGHIGDTYFQLGINGKTSEVHSAVGHCVLDDISEIMTKRKKQWLYYFEKLNALQQFQLLQIPDHVEYNYSYFPVVLPSEDFLKKKMELFRENDILPRRYFYPSLNELPFVDPCDCPVSSAVSRKVICLPLYHDLSLEDQDKVLSVLIS